MKIQLLSLLGLLAAGTARGAVSIILTDPSTTNTTVTITPGGSFTVKLRMSSTGESLSGISYRLRALGSASSGLTIVQRNLNGSAFPNTTVKDGIIFPGTTGLLNPTNDDDMGARTLGAPYGAGTYQVASFTIRALSSLGPGTYTMSTDAAAAYDAACNEIPVNQPLYTIIVVPEPSSALLLGCAAAAALHRRRRRVSGF